MNIKVIAYILIALLALKVSSKILKVVLWGLLIFIILSIGGYLPWASSLMSSLPISL